MALTAHDFNGDGATDLAVADSGGGVTVLFGRDIATLTVNITGSGTVSVQSKAEGTQTATASSTVFQEEGGRELELTATPTDVDKFVFALDGRTDREQKPCFPGDEHETKTVTAVFRFGTVALSGEFPGRRDSGEAGIIFAFAGQWPLIIDLGIPKEGLF